MITTEDRHRIYVAALEQKLFVKGHGLCIRLNSVLSLDNKLKDILKRYDFIHLDPYRNNFGNYPEIAKHRPPNKAFWFSLNDEGDAKRIAILKEAIELTK